MSFQNWSFNPTRNTYTGIYETAEHLPPGLYQVHVDNWGNPNAVQQHLKDDVLHSFKHGPMKNILDEVSEFWDSGDHYKSLGVTHKRGILLHGPAGCGKTGIVAGLIDDIIRRKGIAVQVPNIENFQAAIPLIRQVEKTRSILAVIEDIENICQYDEEELLEVMDGASSLGHGLLFLATTNHLKKIPVRVRCRPSRIDTLIEVPLPTAAQRLEYLKFICRDGFKRSETELKTWASKSKGFSLATLKELVISQVIYKRTLEETVERLKGLSAEKDEE